MDTVPVRSFSALPDLIVPRRTIGGRAFDFSREVAVMAIINRTPDSFYDRGSTFGLEAAVAAARQAIDDGADWVDIGGAKFAPGPPIPIDEEIDRVVPVVEALRGAGVVISVDTFHPRVAAASIAAGAHVINDTTGINDPAMADVIAGSDATLVITHSLAPPRTPHPAPSYVDVVDDPNEPGDPECMIVSRDGTHRLLFVEVPESKAVKNRLHLDLEPVAGSRDDEVARLVGHGAVQVADRRGIYGPRTGWVVLADPEGNEFCVLRNAAERSEA